jgi:hypothetical protein
MSGIGRDLWVESNAETQKLVISQTSTPLWSRPQVSKAVSVSDVQTRLPADSCTAGPLFSPLNLSHFTLRQLPHVAKAVHGVT